MRLADGQRLYADVKGKLVGVDGGVLGTVLPGKGFGETMVETARVKEGDQVIFVKSDGELVRLTLKDAQSTTTSNKESTPHA